MANGSTVADLVSDGRGKWTVLTMLMMTLAGGLSWWFTQEARDELDGLRTYVDGRIASAILAQDSLFNQRIDFANQRLTKLEQIVESQNREIWREMARRVDRDTLEDRRRDYDRRIEALEQRIDNLQNYLFRGGPQ
jgi:hypothetical protein